MPRCARRRRSTRSRRCVAAGRLDERSRDELADAYRLLRTIEHRVQMVDDAQTHLLAGGPCGARQCRPAARARRRRRAARSAAAARRAASGAIFDGLAPETSARLSNDPRHPRARSSAQLGFADAEAARRGTSPTGARARRARCARRRRSRRSKRCCRACSRRSPRAAIPNHALNRLSDIVERLSSGVNLFRLLEARPAAGPAARQDPRPRAGACRPARRAGRSCSKGCSTHRASQCRRRPTSSPQLLAEAMRGQPYDVALDRVRRLVNERRFALGVQLIDRRRDPLEVTEGYARVAEGALLALGEAAAARVRAARTASFQAANCWSSGLGRLRRPFADPRVRPRPHLSAHGAARTARPTAPSRSARTTISTGWRAGSPRRSASRPPPARSTTSTRACGPEGAKGMLVVSLDAFERYQRERGVDLGAYGAVPRAAGVRLARRSASASRAIDRRHPAHAARFAPRSPPTQPRCARRSSATSRRRARST